ncbi:hypothetical protein [Methylomonas sp. CM2]|uniref:hypothetical protein n=1 Tax=Methylomonas sp. CM2 TaxID=3417647 RepID=UPI003CF2E469
MSANSGENWMAELGFSADSELQKALEIAAHIGDVSEDDANISYTSLLIGLLWNGDALSVWLQAQIQRGGVAVENLYRQRRLTEAQREPILEYVRNGRPAASRKVAISISARTVLQEAHTLALETGCAGDAPLATRHVLAAYFFGIRRATIISCTKNGVSKPRCGEAGSPNTYAIIIRRSLAVGRRC